MFIFNSLKNSNKMESHEKTLFKLISEHNFALFKTIFESKRVDINIRDQYGNTLLICAVVSKKNSDCVNFLLEKGIEINAVDKRGRTALFTCCYWGKKGHLKTLLKHKEIDLDQPNDSLGFEINPLAACVLKNRLDCFKMLLYAGANPELCERIIAKQYGIFQEAFTDEFKEVLDFYKRWHQGKKQFILAKISADTRSTQNALEQMISKSKPTAKRTNVNVKKFNNNIFKTVLTEFL